MYLLPRRRPALTDTGDLTIGTTQHFRWLRGVVNALLVLNLLDALFTLWWVHQGLAVEANLFLRDLVHDHPMAFVMAKLGLVSLGAFFLWGRRERPLAVIALFGAFLLYYLVLLHHLRFSSIFLAEFPGF